MKLNIYGDRPIIAPRDPILPLEVTTKRYVDGALDDHVTDQTVHVSQAQRELLDGITVTAEEINSLKGTSGNLESLLDEKLDLAGGTLTGPVIQPAKPTDESHLANKSYVDQEVAKNLPLAGGTLTGTLTLDADPTQDLEASTKHYVDSTVSLHEEDNTIHLSGQQKSWLNSVSVSAEEVNKLSGITDPVQSQLDSKFDKAGGTITGDVTLASGKTVYVSKLAESDSEVVNKAYVDSKIRGQEWKDPVTDINLLGVNVHELPAIVEVGDTYITSETPSGALLGLYAYTYTDTGWIQLQERPVTTGDRFGVALDTTSTEDASVTQFKNKLVTVVMDGNVVGLEADSSHTPGSTTLVFDPDSLAFGRSYSLTDEDKWVVTDTSVNLKSGEAIKITGNAINVDYGDGIIVDSNNRLTVNVPESSIITVDEGGLTIPYNPSHFVKDSTDGLSLTSSITSDISDKLSKTQGGEIEGEVTFNTGSSLKLGFTPNNDLDAVTKQYVDNRVSGAGGDVSGLVTRIEVLEQDPTTKSYVDSELEDKLDLAGGTLTGPVVLHGNPQTANEAANKAYVDSTLTAHTQDDDLHLTPSQNTWIDAITVTSTEVNYLDGVENNVQGQLDGKLDKAGGTMDGMLVLKTDPVNPGEAATKKYVDDKDGLKVSKSGDTMSGPLLLHAEPTVDSGAATKKYVDDAIDSVSGDTSSALAAKVNKTGDIMTGPLTLHGAPVQPLEAATKQYTDNEIVSVANRLDGDILGLSTDLGILTSTVNTLNTDPVTKQYVDNQDATKLDILGGSMQGHITLHADPTQAMHPVTKQYADAIAQGLRVKEAVRYATTGNLEATYSNGSHGVNSTLSGSSNGALVVDGSNVVTGDRILVIRQTNKAHNGDYVVQQPGDASTPFILKRATTVDESHEVPGSFFFVYDGNDMKGTGWTFCVDSPTTFTIGTDPINVNQFSGQGTVQAGNGLSMDGSIVNVETASPNRIVVNADSIDLAVSGVAAGTYTKVDVDAYGRVTSASKPTGYAELGLTDVQPLNSKLSSVSNLSNNGLMVMDSTGQVKVREIKSNTPAITITEGKGNSGDIVIDSNATDQATGSTIVARDASGDFSANVITATLDGNAGTATRLKDSRDFSIEGDVVASAVSFNGTGNVKLTASLANNGVTAGDYTKVTVDSKGLVTNGENPTTLAGYGITDAVTQSELASELSALEEAFSSLYLYVMSRI